MEQRTNLPTFDANGVINEFRRMAEDLLEQAPAEGIPNDALAGAITVAAGAMMLAGVIDALNRAHNVATEVNNSVDDTGSLIVAVRLEAMVAGEAMGLMQLIHEVQRAHAAHV